MVTVAEATWLPFPSARPAPPGDARLAARAITLRSATNSDLPLLARLYAGLRNAELLLVPWSTAEKQAFLDEQFRLQHNHFVRHFRRADFWIVCDTGAAPAGRFYLDRSPQEWRLIDIMLAPGTRGQGIGTTLIRWAQAQATGAGASSIALHVAVNNPRARTLYARMGFVERPSEDGLHIPMLWRTGGS